MKTTRKRKMKYAKTKKTKFRRAVGTTKTTTLFMNGQSQAVRIPKEFRLGGRKVYIKRSGNCIILIPIPDDPWQFFIDSLNEFSPDFMKDGRKQPLPQDRGDIFK